MRVRSGKNATAVTQLVCPARVVPAVPVASSHSRAVLSREPVRTRLPSGENETSVTQLV